MRDRLNNQLVLVPRRVHVGLGADVKPGIHPEFVDCEVTCSCGHSFVTKSTSPDMRIDICSNCHPFFTGTQRLVDSQGQVERFKRRLGKKSQAAEA